MNRKQLTTFGLKFNPFSTEIPIQALHVRPRAEHFCTRLEHLSREGGFALLTGEVGVGKSATMRLAVRHLRELPDVKVGVLTRPQSRTADFYRELGDIFGVSLTPHNRWAGSKVLRERWQEHIQNVLYRPVLLIDEAQELQVAVLGELRLLMSCELDSRLLLTVVLCGDGRLSDKLRADDLLPIHSRIRVRLHVDPLTPVELLEGLRQVIEAAGNPTLITKDVQVSLCEHAAGNWRTLTTMGFELLEAAEARSARTIDEQLFFDVFAQLRPVAAKRNGTGGARKEAR